MPVTWRQSLRASSSVWCTVTYSRSGSMPSHLLPVTHSQAYSIASFLKKAIEYAWEWVTGSKWLGIDPDRLYVTVHHTDDDARKLWRQVTGIADTRIYGLGDKDNFWQMGDTGPCGPCSEILVDI